ncbi:hypothetical protein [Caulobacter sp. Root655]|uniref:hypothetical protein n=1 Tax=Caulobacter sp. Root655 TaxID=1736578 RepID=UPI0012E356E6|nr:hypothetical protein [Caulobacter sp. Root655]
MRRPLTAEKIETASYRGSPEHKTREFWDGLPEAHVGEDGKAQRPGKQDTTICPLTREHEREAATLWVQQALTLGQSRFFEADKDFPKKIWYRHTDGQVWYGFCINSVLGTYKGWPIDEDERVEIFG